MRRAIVPAAKAGVPAGILFAAHALFGNGHLWPMIWPLLAGVAAVLIAPASSRYRDAGARAKLGATAGGFAGVIFLVLTLIGLFAFEREALESGGQLLGSDDPMLDMLRIILAIGIAALLGVALAALGGALAGALRRSPPADGHAH